MHRFANPGRFMRLAEKLTPWFAWLTVAVLPAGLVWGIGFAPADYQQGESVRIMYVHVPAAWMALFIYVCMAVASAMALIWGHLLGHLFARAVAPVGAAFTFLALLTGSLWGKPMWGAWWVWDARLTSVLVLFFLYLGHIALTNAFDDPSRGAKSSAILALVGVVNIPIIKFSVDWWNTLHQPASILRFNLDRKPPPGTTSQGQTEGLLKAPTIDSSMLWPLLITILGFTLFFITIALIRTRSEIVASKLRAAELRSAA
jgi:heme exporter protein C